MLDADLFTDGDLPQWFADAACAGADTALWLAGKGDSYAEALAVCNDCEVRADCLDHALSAAATAGQLEVSWDATSADLAVDLYVAFEITD